MKHQLTGAPLVIADQRPAIKAETRQWQTVVVEGALGQGLEAGTEVVAQQADQASGKRQLTALGQLGGAKSAQRLAQTVEVITP